MNRNRLSVFSIVLLLVLGSGFGRTHLTAAAASPRAAAPLAAEPAAEWIAFINDQSQVVLIHPDGSGLRTLIPPAEKRGYSNSMVAWSAQGRYLAWLEFFQNPSLSKLWVWDSATDAYTALSDQVAGGEVRFAWNPVLEDQILIMINRSEQDRALVLSNLADGSYQPLVEKVGWVFQWGQDGKTILYDRAFASSEPVACPQMPTWTSYDGIYSFDLVTKTSSLVIPPQTDPLYLMSASPNLEQIIYGERKPFCTGMDGFCPSYNSFSAGSEQNREELGSVACTWSDDGQNYACYGGRCGNAGLELFDSTGTLLNRIDTLPEGWTITMAPHFWSPDGSYLIALAGGENANQHSYLLPKDRPQDFTELPGAFLEWSPDSRQILMAVGKTLAVYSMPDQAIITRFETGFNFGSTSWQPALPGPAVVTGVMIQPTVEINRFQLSWTAAAESDLTYEARYSREPIHADTWADAEPIDCVPMPGKAEEPMQCAFNLTLLSRTPYQFAVRARDSQGRLSPVSEPHWIAISNFWINKDGYNFPNTVNPVVPENFTEKDLFDLVGSHLCIFPVENYSDCIRNPLMEDTHQIWYASMKNGLCLGLSIVSERIFIGQEPRYEKIDFDGRVVHDLKLEEIRKEAVMAHVVQKALTQREVLGERGQTSTITELLDDVQTMLLGSGEQHILFMMHTDKTSAHAVVPLALEKSGPDTWRIWTSDTNSPGAPRSIQVNEKEQTWQATHPKDAKYHGNADTHNIYLVPLTVFDPPYLLFPNEDPLSALKTLFVSGGRPLVSDAQGRRTGFLNQDLLEEIPGAQLMPTADQAAGETAYEITLPPGQDFQVVVVQTPETASSSRASLIYIGPDFSLNIKDIQAGAGYQVFLRADPAQIDVLAGQAQTNQVEFSFLRPGETGYTVRLPALALDPTQPLSLNLFAAEQRLAIMPPQLVSGKLDLEVEKAAAPGKAHIFRSAVEAIPNALLVLDLRNWDGSQALPFAVDQDGDGAFEKSALLYNQANSIANIPLELVGGGVLALSGLVCILVAGVMWWSRTRAAVPRLAK